MPELRACASLDADTIHISLAGTYWRLRRGKSLEELWEALDPALDPDDRIPYWTELWPASLLLAEFLLGRKKEISGRLCLDLGCGLGFTALVGKALGANALGIDLALDALRLARAHASPNLAPQPVWLCMDWRNPALRSGIFWRIWAGDIMYEQRFARPLLDFIKFALAPDGRVWIAEPGRAIFRNFLEMAKDRGWRAKKLVSANVRAIHPQKIPVPATIWEFSLESGKSQPHCSK